MRKSYEINKGINKSILFKGLQGQYIAYLAAAAFSLLLLYAVLYMFRVNTFLSLAITVFLGGGCTLLIYHMNATFGEHGLSKALAKRKIPKSVRSRSTASFRPLRGQSSLLKFQPHGKINRSGSSDI